MGISTADSSVNITDRDILHHSLTISSRTEVVASIALGYCRNYTIQSSLLTAIPAAHKDIFATEWIVAKATNESTKLNYKLDVTPVQKDTCLIATADAQAEADRLNTYFSQPRTVYKFTGISKLLSLKLGQSVQMVNSRYNLYNSGDGKTGQVISLTPNWLESTIEVEVIV